MRVLGIDIGGTGIKGAVVDTERGTFVGSRFRIDTPQPANPSNVIKGVAKVVKHFKWRGPVGITLPSVVRAGIVHTAANIDKSWIGKNAQKLFQKKLKLPVKVLNDADAAGIAEMRFGSGKGHDGLVLMVTLGTGIGSAAFFDGVLIPNTEIGHLEVRGKDAERRASNRVREDKGLSWKKWGKNVDEYLHNVEALLWPELFIIGGGVSKKHSRFFPLIKTKAKVVPAQLLNDAGIVGAALSAKVLS